MKTYLTLMAFTGALFFSSSAYAMQTNEELKEALEEAQREIERLRPRTKLSEAVVTRGTPGNVTQRTIEVFIPDSASNINITAFMKNEAWGGHHTPPKADTDDLGSTSYKSCPMGSGECTISWSKVSTHTSTSLPNGRTKIRATFYNWAHRNDRTGKLQVTYQVD